MKNKIIKYFDRLFPLNRKEVEEKANEYRKVIYETFLK